MLRQGRFKGKETACIHASLQVRSNKVDKMASSIFKKHPPQPQANAAIQVSLRDLLNTIFFYRWIWTAIVVGCFVLSGALAVLLPPAYRAEARLLTLYAGYYDMQMDRSSGRAGPSFDPTQVVNVEAQILSSPELHRAVVQDQLGHKAGREALDRALQSFERHFHLEKVDLANLIELSYTDSDPNRAAQVLQRLISDYFRQRSGVFTQGRLSFLVAQRDKVREELDTANAELIAFQRARNVVNIDSQIAAAVALRGLLHQRQLENDSALTQDGSTLAELVKDTVRVPADIELFRDNTEAAHAIDTMQLSLLQLKSRRADLASRYMEQSPFVTELDSQIHDVKTAITAQSAHLVSTVRIGHNSYYDTVQDRILRLQSDVAGEKARQATLEAQNRQADATLQDLIGTANQLRRMEIDRDLLVQTFKNFSQQVEEARIEQNQMDTASSTNVRIIQAPTAPTHRSNPPLLFLAAGLVVGLLLACLAVIVLSSLRETFLSPEEIERSLGLPVLIAPMSPNQPPTALQRLRKNRALQAPPPPHARGPRRGDFGRMIMAVNNSSEAASKLILMLAFRDDDGMPTIVRGLVEDLEARSVRSVLLLDLHAGSGDYGLPDQDGLLHWPGEQSGAPPLQRSPDATDALLSYLPLAGRRVLVAHPRPDAVMPIGRQAGDLFETLRANHDFVVIHAPAASRSFTGIENSVLADATVLAIRAEATRKPVALTLRQQIDEAGGRIAGVAMTNRHSYIPDAIYRFL